MGSRRSWLPESLDRLRSSETAAQKEKTPTVNCPVGVISRDAGGCLGGPHRHRDCPLDSPTCQLTAGRPPWRGSGAAIPGAGIDASEEVSAELMRGCEVSFHGQPDEQQ